MDKKRYKKTRYQNIFKNIKNGNYIVRISNPDTTISRDKNNNKIYDINLAKDIRDNKSNHIIKTQQINNKDVFEKVWAEYIVDCEKKLEYSTVSKKKKMYNKYFRHYFNDLRLSKINKNDISNFINNCGATDKQKNELLKQARAFFSWCIKVELLFINPASNIEKLKVEKPKMKYWTPENLKKILDYLNNDIENDINKETAYLIKMFILLGFNLGARTGEIRALRFKDISSTYNTISISHSIEYNTKSDNYLKSTKNEYSKRTVYISDKLINEIEKYKDFLIKDLKINIDEDTFVIFNPYTKKPYSDTVLRKYFNYYIEKSGVPKIRMYDLRHTYVTTMMTEGYEIYAISKRIGHNDIKTTVNTYGHLSEKIKKEMATSTDKFY